MTIPFFSNFFKAISDATSSVDSKKLVIAAEIIKSTAQHSKKIILIGNGGSASVASHVAVDLTKASKIRAINFNEANLITCFANDYGYENWVVEALKAYADPGDLVILISSSGKSANIVNGALQAEKMGVKIITFTGFSNTNPLRKFGDVEFWVDSENYNVIEMTHHIWLVSIVDFIQTLKHEA